MTPTILTLTVALLLPGEPPSKNKYADRLPHPFAPSLPQLTDEEEEQIDGVIERFIQQDIGKLRGAEAKRAVKEFNQLGPESIPAMIRGMNRAAHIESSCPAVLIAKKLATMLRASTDPELLEFARENIGAGVTRSRHLAVLKELRVACMIRKNQVAKQPAVLRTSPGPPTLRTMTTKELAEALGKERGPRLKMIIAQLERRNGDDAIAALGSAAASFAETELKEYARRALERNLSRLGSAALKEKLKDDSAEVRAAAARVVGSKKLRFGDELIALLSDENVDVREAARAALVKLSGGTDFGPDVEANAAQRAEAVKKWKAWWKKQAGR